MRIVRAEATGSAGSLQWGLNRSPGCRRTGIRSQQLSWSVSEASMGPEPKSRMQVSSIAACL